MCVCVCVFVCVCVLVKLAMCVVFGFVTESRERGRERKKDNICCNGFVYWMRNFNLCAHVCTCSFVRAAQLLYLSSVLVFVNILLSLKE